MAELDKIDVALLPVWGWGPTLGPGHLTPARAAEALDLLRPASPSPCTGGTLALAGLPHAPGHHGARMRRRLVDPPHEFTDKAAGSPTRVIVTPPGEDVALPDLARGVPG